jgi:fibronectin type 3 domain-containing protein
VGRALKPIFPYPVSSSLFPKVRVPKENAMFKKKWRVLLTAFIAATVLFAGCDLFNPDPKKDDPPPPLASAPTVTVGDQQLTVNWTAVSEATMYEVYYNTTNTTASAQQSGGDITGTTATITGLTNGTTYYVWVKAKNAGGTSDFSPRASGKPVAAPPEAPAVPTVSAGNNELGVNWTAVTGATAYEVYFHTTDDSAAATKFGADVTTHSATITGLTNTTTYYVWVKAKNADGTSSFSPSASGTPTSNSVSTPTGVVVTVGTGQLTVTWNAVTGATAYEVYSHTANDSAAATKFGADVTATTATITGLTNGTTYYVWVKAKNAAGIISAFSFSVNGTPVAPPTAPTVPAITAANNRLTVDWADVPYAASYEVYSNTTDNSATATQFGADITGTTATITGLTNGTTYYVWVKAKNAAGTSGFSPSASGTPALTVPAIPAVPTIAVDYHQLTVTWPAVIDTASYEVRYHTANDSSTAQQFGGDITGTTVTITGLTNNTLYYVWVKAKNASGESDFSPSASGTPVLLAPSAPSVSTGDTELTATWTGVNSATSYEVYYSSTDNSATATQSGGGVTTTSATITGLTNGTTYYVWVKAKNATDTSDFSPGASGLPVLSAPATPLFVVNDQRLTAAWTPVPGATAYEVHYSATDDPTSATKFGADVTTTSATITGLSNGNTYHVWVKAKDASTSDFSPGASGTPTPLPATGYFKGDILPPYDDGIGLSATHFYQYDDGALSISYAGEIIGHIPDDTAANPAGILIIRITDGGSWYKTPGNYFGVAYRNYLYSSTTQTYNIQTSSAYKTGGFDTVSTIAEAVVEYTDASYYTYYGSYRKFRDEVPQKDLGLTLNGLEGAWTGEDDYGDEYAIRIANPVLTWTANLYGYGIAQHHFAGTIVETTASSADSGYIYIKVDFVNPSGDYDNLEVGNYYAIHWKDQAGGGIKLCAAYGDNDTGTATLAEAKTEYTVANDYFDDDYYVVIEP